MDKATKTHFNFPIKMMQGVLRGDNSKKQEFLKDLLYFHIQKHSDKIEDLNEYEETGLQRFKRSADYWNVEMKGDITGRFIRGQRLVNEHYNSKVFVGISRDVFWDFYNDEKTDFEWECLFAFLSLKSIIGKRKFTRTINELMFARMCGKETLKDYQKIKGLQMTEYHRNKIINHLRIGWNLIYYAKGIKGFCYSFGMKQAELIKLVEENKPKNKIAKLQEEEKRILQDLKIKGFK